MILETAKISILPDKHHEFEAAVSTAVSQVLTKARGFISINVLKGIEEKDSYLLHITWKTLEDHTIGFRESELFVKWREIIGPFFAAPPVASHWEIN